MATVKTKVCIVGEASVGKTCLIKRLILDSYSDIESSTIGCDVQSKTIMVDDKPHCLNIWDTAGQERFRSMSKIYYHNARAAVAVYDATVEESIKHVSYWISEIRINALSGVKIYIAGNKCDLETHPGVAEIEKYAKSEGMVHMLTSAKTGENVIALFEEIARNVEIRQPEFARPSPPVELTSENHPVKTDPSNDKQKRRCCR